MNENIVGHGVFGGLTKAGNIRIKGKQYISLNGTLLPLIKDHVHKPFNPKTQDEWLIECYKKDVEHLSILQPLAIYPENLSIPLGNSERTLLFLLLFGCDDYIPIYCELDFIQSVNIEKINNCINRLQQDYGLLTHDIHQLFKVELACYLLAFDIQRKYDERNP